MTELYIDGTEVILPKGFSIQVKKENPLFTKNGEYTYDITLSLTNPVNAELYRHINRMNTLPQNLSSKRSAVLMADNRVYCNGTEVITAWTDDSVSIQVVSGNSELNYIIGNDLLISSLEMKSSAIPSDEYIYHVENCYPEIEVCLAPIVNQSSGTIINQWCIKTDTGSTNRRVDVDDIDTIAPQPYLIPYIQEVLRGLNYDLILNQLEDTPYKYLYLCHDEVTDEWCRMLPGWTVKDFLEEIEKLFNCIFVVNNRKRTVQLMIKSNYFAGSATAHVSQVEDLYEIEKEEPDTDDHSGSNIEYVLPDNEFWRWQCLSEAVKKASKEDVIPADYVSSSLFPRIQDWFKNTAHQLNDTIYTDLSDGRKYLYLRNREGWTNQPDYAMVDSFAQIDRESSAEISLDIIPATFVIAEVNMYESGENERSSGFHLYLPSVSTNDKDEDNSETQTLEQMIEDGVTESSNNSKKAISIAFYRGLSEVESIGGLMYPFPRPFIDEYIANGNGGITEYYLTNTDGASLRLSKMDSLFYQGGYDVDYHTAVKIHSYDANVFDCRLLFEIRNKRYICKEIEYTLAASGRKGAWTGTFYPIKISDTEADARWILSDGKWRDGGVFLDNGRWLDS